MTKKYVHEVSECIGCGACASISPKYWKMDGSKSKLLKKEIDEKDLDECKEAKDACPVACIKIIDEKGKEL